MCTCMHTHVHVSLLCVSLIPLPELLTVTPHTPYTPHCHSSLSLLTVIPHTPYTPHCHSLLSFLVLLTVSPACHCCRVLGAHAVVDYLQRGLSLPTHLSCSQSVYSLAMSGINITCTSVPRDQRVRAGRMGCEEDSGCLMGHSCTHSHHTTQCKACTAYPQPRSPAHIVLLCVSHTEYSTLTCAVCMDRYMYVRTYVHVFINMHMYICTYTAYRCVYLLCIL